MKTSELLYYNDYGGFTKDGKEYVIKTSESFTPMPWAHIIANPEFGTIVTSRAVAGIFGARIAGITSLLLGQMIQLRIIRLRCFRLKSIGRIVYASPYKAMQDYELHYGFRVR